MAATLHGELTADHSQIVLIAIGDDWEMDAMGAALRKLTPLLSASKPPGALLCPASWPAVVQLAFTFDGLGEHGFWVPGPALTKWIATEFAKRAAQPDTLHAKPPVGLVPRPYQVDGARMIAAAGRFLLCDEPGLGKTACTILGLRERGIAGVSLFPAVVVVPSWDVADVWAREIASWAPHWSTAMWGGPNRQSLPGTSDLYITTYATARIDAADAKSPLVKLKPATVVADECHALKSSNSKQSLAVRRIAARAQTVVGLSGTPITRDTGDLWPTLAAMEPLAWPARERFIKRYCDREDSDYGEVVQGLNRLAEPEFRDVLLGSYRRVAKADVLAQLPPKVYSVRRVELPPEWRKAYDSMEEDMLAQLPDGGELPVMSVLAQLTRLSQLASSAADVETTTEIGEDGLEHEHYTVTLKTPSWKADALCEILAERPGQPVVAFAPSKQLIMIAGNQAAGAGYKVGFLTGGVSKGDRTAAIESFQAGRLDLLAATTGAGGTGITLTAAGTVVVLQRPWSLAESLQMEDRAHRLGSERHEMVEIIDVIARDTVDTRVRAALREKAGQLADLVKDSRIVKELLGGIK